MLIIRHDASLRARRTNGHYKTSFAAPKQAKGYVEIAVRKVVSADQATVLDDENWVF